MSNNKARANGHPIYCQECKDDLGECYNPECNRRPSSRAHKSLGICATCLQHGKTAPPSRQFPWVREAEIAAGR